MLAGSFRILAICIEKLGGAIYPNKYSAKTGF